MSHWIRSGFARGLALAQIALLLSAGCSGGPLTPTPGSAEHQAPGMIPVPGGVVNAAGGSMHAPSGAIDSPDEHVDVAWQVPSVHVRPSQHGTAASHAAAAGWQPPPPHVGSPIAM